jgi:hypothetical protein
VSIPAALVPYRRLRDGVEGRHSTEGRDRAEQHLRFQLPSACLPLKIERVRLTVRVEAPGRRVSVSAREGGAFVEVHRADSPVDAIRVEIVDPRRLVPDEQGGLHLELTVSQLLDPKAATTAEDRWFIRSIELEVIGQIGG